MDGDTYEGETTTTGFFSRMCGAMGTCVMGIVLVPLIIIVIFFNESNYVKSDATAAEVEKALVVEGCRPLDGMDGKLVYAACNVIAPDLAPSLPDPIRPFVPKFYGASLSWKPEIYQWTESSSQSCTKNNDGSKSCTTSYTYNKRWQSSRVSSSSFHVQNGQYENHGDLPSNVQSDSTQAPEYSVFLTDGSKDDGFVLDRDLTAAFPSANVDLQPEQGGGDGWQEQGPLSADMLQVDVPYLVTYNGAPEIGDVRITVTGQRTNAASVCGQQTTLNNGRFAFEAYPPQVFDFWGRKGYTLKKLEPGRMTPEEFEEAYKTENMVVAWLFRVVCLIALIAAFNCCFEPVSVSMDLVMMLNNVTCCCECGSMLDKIGQTLLFLLSCACGCSWFWFFWALAWVVVHPTLALIFMIGGLALSAGFFFFVLPAMKGKTADGREFSRYAKMMDCPGAIGEPVLVQRLV